MPTAPTKAGKGLGVAGFVIALVALVFWVFVSGAAVLQAAFGGGMPLSIFWVVLSLLGFVLALMGFMAAKKGNGKKGLAITGIVLGLVATALSIRTVMVVKEVKDNVGKEGQEMLDKMKEGFKDIADSAAVHMNESMKEMADSMNTK